MFSTNNHIVQEQLIIYRVIIQMRDSRHIWFLNGPLPGHVPHAIVNDDIYSLHFAIAYKLHRPLKLA